MLLGAPRERAESADGSVSTTKLVDGTKIVTPEAEVSTATYSVKLSVSYDDLTVGETADLLGASVRRRKVLDRTAILFTDHTLALTFGGGRVNTGTGGLARHLLVARDPKDGGGAYELAVWRQDDVPPDETALFRIAERVLPTVPGWSAG